MLQDFKHRLISWPLIPLLLLCFLAQGLIKNQPAELLQYTLFNTAFVLLQLIALTLYISIKNKKMVNIINSYMGLGDVLFFAVITTAFSPVNFIFFYLSGLVFTLVSYRIYIGVNKAGSKEIPLAGTMSVVMIITLLADCCASGNYLYDDTLLTHWMVN